MNKIKKFTLPTPTVKKQFVAPGQTFKRQSFIKRSEGVEIAQLRSSARWQRLRTKMLSTYPTCFICGDLATEVHHIIEAAVDRDLFFDIDNLASVCESCQKKVHGAYRRGFTWEFLIANNEKETTDGGC